MTIVQRNEAIRSLIRDYTAKKATDRDSARTTLIKEGIYTPKGNLKAEFGGRGSKK